MDTRTAITTTTLCALAVALTACSGRAVPAPSAPSATVAVASSSPRAQVSPLSAAVEAQPTAPPGSTVAAPGCGSTPVYQGSVPGWLTTAAGGGAGLTDLPYVMAHPTLAGGFLFGHPLRAGRPENPANKILWAVRTLRQDAPLEHDAHPLGALSPHVHYTQQANSSPGEIYPSIIDMPTPGCWVVSLTWATGSATVELEYA